MSLQVQVKRKAIASITQDTSSKKAKLDFFAPRTSAATQTTKFDFKPTSKDSTRLVTWNVNGIKSVDEKILKKYLEAEDPSILVLTETKYSKGKPDILCLKTRFKFQFWGTDPKPGNAGIAILSKTKPLESLIGLPTWSESPEEMAGRYIQLEFEDFYVVGTYVPNAGDNLQNLVFKRKWNAALAPHLRELNSKKPVIWAGDFNCIPTRKDLDKTAQAYWNRMGGLSEAERSDLEDVLKGTDENHPQFVDAWRHIHPEAEEYTHSSGKYGAWRLDSFILSHRMLEKVVDCEIRHELKDLKLSDHWPVTLDISLLL